MRAQSVLQTLTVCLLAAMLPSTTTAGPLRLATFDSPPLQMAPDDGNRPITGTATATVRCVLDKMGVNADINLAPPRRGQLQLRRNQVDGVFSMDTTVPLEPAAWPSAPIALEKWHFVSREPFHTIDAPLIGVVRGSNEANWLSQRNRYRTVRVSSHAQLLPLLTHERVDAILEDIQVFRYRADNGDSASTTIDQLRTSFVRYAPLHLYASSALLERNPGFLNRFNRQIPQCTGSSTMLDDDESKRIRDQARKLFASLEASVAPAEAATRLPPYQAFRAMITADQLWKANMPRNTPVLAKRLAGRRHSRLLEQWQEPRATLVNEAFITDWQGAIAAASQPTSDFWQGDEAKFRALLGTTPDTIVMEPLRYDASTRRFQVMVSRQVRNQHGQFAGVVVLGVDVEAALFRSETMTRSPEPNSNSKEKSNGTGHTWRQSGRGQR